MKLLPDYAPPNARPASAAAGGAPLVILLAFTLLVSRMIDAQTCFAWFLGSTIWVVVELTRFQRTLDAYNEGYVRRHLQWRSSETLCSLIAAEDTTAATREFVQRFIDDGRVVLPDGASA